MPVIQINFRINYDILLKSIKNLKIHSVFKYSVGLHEIMLKKFE